MGLRRRYLDWRQRHVVAVEPTADGFLIRRGRERIALEWARIERAAAYKRDLLTTDLLCVAMQDDAGIHEINEEMPGFEAVVVELERSFGLAPDWRLPILFPAFAANPTILLERRASADDAPRRET